MEETVILCHAHRASIVNVDVKNWQYDKWFVINHKYNLEKSNWDPSKTTLFLYS